MSGPRTFFGDIVFLFFLVFLVFLEFFLVFGSGSFYRLLSLPKTQKPKNLEKNQTNQKKTKKTKKPKHSEECLGQGLSSETLFFFVFLFFFWFSSSFFSFWFRKLLPATKTTKNPKTLKKTPKKRVCQECVGQGLCSEALFFVVVWFFSSFGCLFFPMLCADLLPQTFLILPHS